jgi:putative SOS response-associated peptidase YedK
MCGRFTLFLDAETLKEDFGLVSIPVDFSPRYNVAPSTQILAVRDSGDRKAEWFRWGLIPSWAKDPAIGNRMINARSETLLEKASFRNAAQRRRCMILANGFYEWQRGQGKSSSTPFYFQRKDRQPVAFAGLWEFWRSPDGEELRTSTIITCAANQVVAPIHERMPVMLSLDNCFDWIKPGPAEGVMPLLAPYDPTLMEAIPVSRAVNAPAYDGPDLIIRID